MSDDAMSLNEVLCAAIKDETTEDVVRMVGVILGEALVAALSEDLKTDALAEFNGLVEAVGYERATGYVFSLLAGMSLRARRDETGGAL